MTPIILPDSPEPFEPRYPVGELDDPQVAIDLPPPVTIELVRDHAYKKRAGGRGCAVCTGAKYAAQHLGAPPSLNTFLAAGPFAYAAAKGGYQDAFTAALGRSSLPKGLASVGVEAWACFGQRRERDEGNFRFLAEKALGDALVAGGWLPSDEFYVYQFNRLHPVYVKGEKQTWLRLTITPQLGDLA